MALNAKVAAEIDRQVTAGKMDAAYAASLKTSMSDAPDDFQAAFLARPDYDRSQQALRDERLAFEANKTEWKTWHSTAKQEFDTAQQTITDLQAKLAAGNLSMNNEVDIKKEIEAIKTSLLSEFKNQGFVTKTEYETALAQAKKDGVGLMGDILGQQRKIESQYLKDFGKQFDPTLHDELVTIANETAAKQGRYVPLEDAYKIKFGEDVKNLEREHWKAEGAKEAEAKFTRDYVPGGGGGLTGGSQQLGPLQERLKQGMDFTKTDGDLQAAKAGAVDALRQLSGR